MPPTPAESFKPFAFVLVSHREQVCRGRAAGPPEPGIGTRHHSDPGLTRALREPMRTKCTLCISISIPHAYLMFRGHVLTLSLYTHFFSHSALLRSFEHNFVVVTNKQSKNEKFYQLSPWSWSRVHPPSSHSHIQTEIRCDGGDQPPQSEKKVFCFDFSLRKLHEENGSLNTLYLMSKSNQTLKHKQKVFLTYTRNMGSKQKQNIS